MKRDRDDKLGIEHDMNVIKALLISKPYRDKMLVYYKNCLDLEKTFEWIRGSIKVHDSIEVKKEIAKVQNEIKGVK